MFLLSSPPLPLLHFPFLVTSYYPAVVNFIPRDRTKERRWYQTVFATFTTHSGPLWHQRIRRGRGHAAASLDRPLFARGKSYFLTLPPWIRTRYEKFVGAFLLGKKRFPAGSKISFSARLYRGTLPVSWFNTVCVIKQREEAALSCYTITIDIIIDVLCNVL